jgi:tetratricopeptide (TPR) repeat protein
MIQAAAATRWVAVVGLIACGELASRGAVSAAQVGDPLMLGDQAAALAAAGRYDGALARYKTALAIFDRRKDHLGAADTCLRIASVLRAAARPREAVAYVDHAIREAASLPEHGERLSLLLDANYLGAELTLDEERSAAAFKYVAEMTRLASQEGAHTGDYVSKLSRLAASAMADDDSAKAFLYLRAAVALQQGSWEAAQVDYLTALANASLSLDAIDPAVQAADEAKRLLAALPARSVPSSFLMTAKTDLAEVYLRLGATGQGLALLRAAAGLDRDVLGEAARTEDGDERRFMLAALGRLYGGLASGYLRDGSPAQAAEALSRARAALATLAAGNDRLLLSFTVAEVEGDIAFAAGDHATAARAYARTPKLAKEWSSRLRSPEDPLHALFGEPSLVQQMYKDFPAGDRIQLNYTLGRALADGGRGAAAVGPLLAAIGDIETRRLAISAPEFRSLLFGSYADIYRDLIDVLYALHATGSCAAAPQLAAFGRDCAEAALHFAESLRARVLAERSGRAIAANIAERDKIPRDLIDREQHAVGRLRAAEDVTALAAPRGEGRTLSRRLQGIAQAQAELKGAIAEIAKRYPVYGALAYPEPIAVRQVTCLSPGEYFLEYQVTRRGVYSWVVHRGKVVDFFLSPVESAELASVVARLRPQGGERLWGFREEVGNELFRLVALHPVNAVRESMKSEGLADGDLILAPDGELYLVPFELLIDMQGRYLSDQYPMSYVPSLTMLGQLRLTVPASERVTKTLLVGDVQRQELRLPVGSFSPERGFRVGLEGMKSLLAAHGEATTVIRGDDAKAQLLQANLKQYSYVVFFTHAYAESREPEPSLILGSQVSSLLGMTEIGKLSLAARMVLLPVCETALGSTRQPVPGEGITGLAQAFFAAGTSAVLASLWKVDIDSAAALTQELLPGLVAPSRSINKARALQAARRELRRNHPSPYLWASLILIGDSR